MSLSPARSTGELQVSRPTTIKHTHTKERTIIGRSNSSSPFVSVHPDEYVRVLIMV